MKQNLRLSHLWRVALCGCVAASLTSCIDNDYDLDNGISGEANILGSVTIPIGTISPIYIGEIINADSIDELSLTEDGRYVLSVSDSFAVSIDDLGDDLAISIEGVSEGSDINENIADNTELPSFDLSISSSTEMNIDMDGVSLESSTEAIEGSSELAPSYPTAIKLLAANPAADISVSQIELPVEVDPIVSEIEIAPDMECPSEVVKVSNILFGGDSKGVEVTVDLDITSLAQGFEALEWQTPVMTLEFPEGFTLSSGSNVVSFPSALMTSSLYKVSTQILSYDIDIIPNEDGSITPMEIEVVCSVSGDMTVISGVTNGSAIDIESGFSLNVTSEELAIGDLDITVEGVEVPIEGIALSESVNIDGIPDNVTAIGCVSFVEGANDLTISIDPIYLPEGLGITSGESLVIEFPADRFAITGADAYDAIRYKYQVLIPTKDLVGSQTVTKVITIDSMHFESYPIVDGVLAFDPAIEVAGATISMGGKLAMSDYNSFLESHSTQEVSFAAEAAGMEVLKAELTVDAIEIEIPAQSTAIEIYEEIPTEVEALYGMDFVDEVTATISINITGLPTGDDVGDLVFDGYTITFPEFIVFAEGEVDENNSLSLDGVVLGDKTLATRSYKRVMYIEEFDFTAAEYAGIIKTDDAGDRYVSINDEVELEGGLVLQSGDATSEVSDITGRVEFELSDITVKSVTGRINPEIPEVKESIDLSELTESISLDDMSLILTNPTISLDVKNSLTIGLDISELILTPYKSGVAKSAMKSTESIPIAALPLDVSYMYETTSILFSAYESSAEGCYQIEGLESILADMPDSLQIEVVAEVAGETHTIDLTGLYDLKLDYEVNVPLEFEALEVNYTDTLSDLSSTFEDIVEYISEVELRLDVASTLPFTVELLNITAMDANDNVLDLPNMLGDGCTINGSDGSVAISQLVLNLSDNDAGDLMLLDKLLFSIKATVDSESGSAALDESQYIQFGLKLYIPDGLNIDLDEF